MKEEIDYCQMFLDMKDKEDWYDGDTLKGLNDCAERERKLFNDFMKYHLKKTKKKIIEEKRKQIELLKQELQKGCVRKKDYLNLTEIYSIINKAFPDLKEK